MRQPGVVVIGLGSDHGDDAVAWDIVSRLNGVATRCTSDPLSIADLPSSCELVILVDACRGAGPPGSVHRFVWPDERLAARRITSSHGWGLAEGLQLAEALRRLPRRVVVFAVEVESAEPGERRSPQVVGAVPRVLELILREIQESS